MKHYTLFVSFFPQLIAGPIVRYHQVISQITGSKKFRFNAINVSEGATIFIVGLFKKVCLADGLAPYVNLVFTAANDGASLSFFEAWGGVLSFSLQIYFDFSAYSDMAIGLSRMMGVKLPINFNSPYKAVNFIDFWSRWHITLSTFLRDYLYIPLGGSRKGEVRRYVNILITMLLGGLWHGANWTFICWGGLHGLFILSNHAWHRFRRLTGLNGTIWGGRFLARFITFLGVTVAWVFFRADSFSAAWSIVGGMSGKNGAVLPEQFLTIFPFLRPIVSGQGTVPYLADSTVMGCVEMGFFLLLGLGIVLFGKNLYEVSQRKRLYIVVLTLAFTMQQILFSKNISEFLYFRF